MKLPKRLLLYLALPSLGYAENIDTILDKESIKDVVVLATGGHKILEETALPKSMSIGKVLDWAPKKSEASPIVMIAGILWPDARLIEHCRIEVGDKVQEAKQVVIANIREVLLPSLIPPNWPAKLLACKDIPTVGHQYGWIEAADKVIGKSEGENMRCEIQDDGLRISFLIVPSVQQQEGEKTGEFALKILKQFTKLPETSNFGFKTIGIQNDRIATGVLLENGLKEDETEDEYDGDGKPNPNPTRKANAHWYRNAWLCVHAKFVYVSVSKRDRRYMFSASAQSLEYPDRF